MRGIRRGAMAAAAALLAIASPAHARELEVAGGLAPSGGITISWHGDPARGCAAAGLCGYSGSVLVRPDDGEYDFTVRGGRLREGYSFLDVFSKRPVVRVTRTEGGSAAGACVDVPAGAAIDMTSARAGRDRLRLGIDSEGISVGRCAGPELRKLLARLPRRTRSLSRITAGRARPADFSAEVPFSEGRFSGTIRSTLRIRFAKGARAPVETFGGGPSGHSRLVRIVDVRAVYRVTGFAGSFTTSFAPLTDPPCAELDACGVAGSSTWSVDSAQGTVVVHARARARRGDRGVSGGLAAVRRGPASVAGEGDLARNLGTTTADVRRSGGTPCHDTASTAAPGVAVFNDPARLLTFELDGEEAPPPPADLLRTGCPGPLDEDVLGLDPAAVGSVPLDALGKSAITVRMTGSHRFSTKGYGGTSSLDFDLGLRRASVRATYRLAAGIE